MGLVRLLVAFSRVQSRLQSRLLKKPQEHAEIPCSYESGRSGKKDAVQIAEIYKKPIGEDEVRSRKRDGLSEKSMSEWQCQSFTSSSATQNRARQTGERAYPRDESPIM